MTPQGNSGNAERGASVAGTVRLPDGRPVGSAAVTVAEPGTGRQVGAARTGPSGTFDIGLAAGGTYLVIVSAPGRRPAAELVAVAGGQARRDVVLVGSGVLTGVARIAGTSDPAPGVVVTLTDARGQVVATGTTADDGRYRLDGLEAGDYTLVGTAVAVDPVARAVTVPGTEDLTLAAPGYRVAAIVTGPDGAPFAGAVVTLSGSGGALATNVSDFQGWVTFEDIPADRYTLAAVGCGPGAAVARAGRGRVARADIRLGAPSHTGEHKPNSWFLPELWWSCHRKDAMADDVTKEVLAAEERRCAAIAAQDWEALGAIVADEFFYTHSVGKTEDKSAWIAGLKKRRRAVEHDRLTVRGYGDVALLSGSSVYRYAEPFRGDSHYGSALDVLQVWVRRPEGWQIVAQHGVKLPDQ
jgi:hypothetical protein